MSREIAEQAANKDAKGIEDLGVNSSDSARGTLQQTALTLFECKDGSLVTNPRDCYNTNVLPRLRIDGA